ncbi:MAG: methylated-DNA--[protein]-cysteine S-methyltransferase [Actinomycetia bacterium]|nr:methylated-DNA--[protein]-cysteine S-methyltransferase [Actinomycetes bacterium]
MSDARTIEACTIETPVKPLTIVARDQIVIAAGFTSIPELWDRLTPPERGERELVERSELGKITRLVEDYLDGQLDALARIPVAQPGTDLQQEVWAGLRTIPAGETRTYTELAAVTTRPRAIRAAGTACGRNLIAPMVPCHRALRQDGSLGGYYYGLEVKRWLLDHEARAAA